MQCRGLTLGPEHAVSEAQQRAQPCTLCLPASLHLLFESTHPSAVGHRPAPESISEAIMVPGLKSRVLCRGMTPVARVSETLQCSMNWASGFVLLTCM